MTNQPPTRSMTTVLGLFGVAAIGTELDKPPADWARAAMHAVTDQPTTEEDEGVALSLLRLLVEHGLEVTVDGTDSGQPEVETSGLSDGWWPISEAQAALLVRLERDARG